jgi:hypothetical protein
MTETIDEQVKYILSLKEDWDDEGSPSYNKKTTNRALEYIPKLQEILLKEKGLKIGNPRVCPGPKTSIDLLWETNWYRMLANVKPEGKVEYYWHTLREDELKGTLN